MTKEQTCLCENIKRLGYVQGNQVRHYGEIFDLVSDPLAIGDNVVFLDARERRSGHIRRVRTPMNVVQVPKQEPGCLGRPLSEDLQIFNNCPALLVG